jgi:DNA-3-methyladenine glycosylase
VRLPSAFYQRPTITVAHDLLAKLLVRQLSDGTRLAGLIVEVEAYLSADDPASHSFRGPGRKNASMFLPAGTLYVYPIHAKFCMNVVTEREGVGAAVLIRALEPVEGIETMRMHRGNASSLATGPARLCQALAIDRSFDGEDLRESQRVWIEGCEIGKNNQWRSRVSSRIGISQAQEMQLRWFVDGNRFVSGCARDHSNGRRQSFG